MIDSTNLFPEIHLAILRRRFEIGDEAMSLKQEFFCGSG